MRKSKENLYLHRYTVTFLLSFLTFFKDLCFKEPILFIKELK